MFKNVSDKDVKSLLFSFKGAVRLEIVRDGKVIQVHEQDNLWLDQGTRLILSGIPSIHLILSASDADATYTDTVIPNVITSSAPTRTFESATIPYRHRFLALFPAPGAQRVVRTVGLSTTTTGDRALCSTRLTTPLVQEATDVLFVIYFIYVIQSASDGTGFLGYLHFARDICFSTSGLRVGSVLYSGATGVSKKDENNHRVFVAISPTMSTILSLNTDKYKVFSVFNIAGIGDTTPNSGIWTGFRIFSGWDNGILSIPFAWKEYGLSRVWPKGKASVAHFFDIGSLPVGYSRAIEVRPRSGFDIRKVSCASHMEAHITAGGGIGTAQYYLRSIMPSTTASLRSVFGSMAVGWLSNFIGMGYECLFNKFGRNWYVMVLLNDGSPRNIDTVMYNLENMTSCLLISNASDPYVKPVIIRDQGLFSNKLYYYLVKSALNPGRGGGLSHETVFMYPSDEFVRMRVTSLDDLTTRSDIAYSVPYNFSSAVCDSKGIIHFYTRNFGRIFTFDANKDEFIDIPTSITSYRNFRDPYITQLPNNKYRLYYAHFNGTGWELAYYDTTDTNPPSIHNLESRVLLDIGGSITNSCIGCHIERLPDNRYRLYYSKHNELYWQLAFRDTIDTNPPSNINLGSEVLMGIGSSRSDQVMLPHIQRLPDNKYRLYYTFNNGTFDQLAYRDTTDTNLPSGANLGSQILLGIGSSSSDSCSSTFIVRLSDLRYRIYYHRHNGVFRDIMFRDTTDANLPSNTNLGISATALSLGLSSVSQATVPFIFLLPSGRYRLYFSYMINNVFQFAYVDSKDTALPNNQNLLSWINYRNIYFPHCAEGITTNTGGLNTNFSPRTSVWNPPRGDDIFGSFGMYDSDIDAYVLNHDQAMYIIDKTGTKDRSNFNGIVDMSGSQIRDFSFIVTCGSSENAPGSFSKSDGRITMRICSGSSSFVGAFPRACLGFVLKEGRFEATCAITFDPAVVSQSAGLAVSAIDTNTVIREIRKVFTTAKRIEVHNNNVSEAGVAFTAPFVRFRVVRDTDNIVRFFYSIDPLTTPDASANWIAIGATNVALPGIVRVMITGMTNSDAPQIDCSIHDFRINSGIVNRRVNAIYLGSGFSSAVEPSLYNSNGSVIKRAGHYYLLTTSHILKVNSTTYEVVGSTLHNLNTAISSTHFRPVLLRGHFMELDAVITEVYSSHLRGHSIFYRYDMIDDTFVKIMDRANTWPVVNQVVVPFFNNDFLTGAHQRIQVFNRTVWGWDAINRRWAIMPVDIAEASIPKKATHSGWEDVPFEGQLRCLPHPTSPTATFNTADKYTYQVAARAFIKDNMQYITGLYASCYLGNAKKAIESYRNISSVFTLNSRTNNLSTWLTADINDYTDAFYLKNADGTYAYWTNIITANRVSSVVSNSEFLSDNIALSFQYNIYKDRWVRFTSGANNGIARRIVDYDGYNKKFVVEPAFPNSVSVGDTFDIVVPAKMILHASDYNMRVTPIMTSNTAPSGIASASAGEAWRAFDGVHWPGWSIPAGVGWLSYEFGGGVTLIPKEYIIHSPRENSPRNWTFEAWDGSRWIVLDTQVNQVVDGSRIYVIQNYTHMTPYSRFRINITASNGTWIVINELILGGIRSGNVAYFNSITGQFSVHPSDVGRNLDAEYVYVLRSW